MHIYIDGDKIAIVISQIISQILRKCLKCLISQNNIFKELSDLDLEYVTQSFERCVVDLNAKAEKLDDRMKPVPSKNIFFFSPSVYLWCLGIFFQ